MQIDLKTSLGYAYVHYAMEVLCFFVLFRVFGNNGFFSWWLIAFLYDTLAFAPQSIVGSLCEKYPRFRPGQFGIALLLAGALMTLIAAQGYGSYAGLIILSIGNAFLHVAGALATLRVSNGRMSESGIFVGAGAFGVITGRLLGSTNGPVWLPFALMAAALLIVIMIDKGLDKASFDDRPCMHDAAADRPAAVIVIVLALVVAVRSYISNGIPTDWNKTELQLVMLFAVMGIGKMLGGVLADIFGARRVGVITCVASVPFLLAGADIMWISLIGIAIFSMTMAVALGGIVSVMKKSPGTAFGITTLMLFIGTLPVAFFGIPGRTACIILIIILSLASAGGMFYTLENNGENNGKED